AISSPDAYPETNRSRPPSRRQSGSPASFALISQSAMSKVPMPPNVAAAWLALNAREHAVVERGYRAGILALDRREDLRQVLVRAHSDAADALIRVHDDKWHLGDARCDVP